MNDKISDKDKKDWDDFILKKQKLPNKDINLEKKYIKKVDSLDLHGFHLDQANKEIEKFIIRSYESGLSKLIIVTGKGLHSENDRNPYISKCSILLKHMGSFHC